MGDKRFAPLKRAAVDTERQMQKANEGNSSTRSNNTTSPKTVKGETPKVTTHWQPREPTPAFNRLMSLLLTKPRRTYHAK
jgi:hypothetical protein